MLQDYKLGLRMLLKYPGLTIAGGLALAIAVATGAGWYDFAASSPPDARSGSIQSTPCGRFEPLHDQEPGHSSVGARARGRRVC